MEPFLLKIFGAAGITSAAAICASAINRFRNVPAAGFALAGGTVPWLVLAMLYHWLNDTAFILGLFSIAPLFLVAILFYLSDEPTARRNVIVAVVTLGMFAGITFCVFVGCPLMLRGV